MNYEDTITFLYSQLPVFQRSGKAAYKANLINTIKLDDFYESPHRKFRSIHIAGTNGKGSVAHMIASVLQNAGYKTGLYTSPHLLTFRERIKVNGKMISKDFIVDFVKKSDEIIEKISPSFFELTVAMAFKYFADQEVDVAIIEVGLGGRLDSTNIVTPELAVITNIGYDHTEFLGDTLQEIAYEKAGIIKPDIPVVIGQTQPETEGVFIEFAQRNKSTIHFADKSYKSDYSLTTIDGKRSYSCINDDGKDYKELKIDLLGNYQKDNLMTALKCFDVLSENNFHIKRDDIYNGLENISNNTGIKGRWQILGNNPLIIADTGHNINGISEVVSQIKNTAYKNLHFVIGFVNDKKIDQILNLLPKKATYYFTKAQIPRAMDELILLQKASEIGLIGKAYPTVEVALKYAKINADFNDLVFIGGSTFIVAEAI